jgi:hypothetical protein
MSEEEAHAMARTLERYIRGSASGVFDRRSTINIHNTFTVFSIRDLTDELRPLAMYVMLDYIWTKIRKDKRRRLLIVDEAWIMMQHEDAARFVYSIAKRARKYGLGLTTITQDVDDFLTSDYGKAIVSNAALQILLKQSPSSIDKLQKVFYLTDGEKQFLLSAGIGQGIFFAGANHVAIQVVASENEHTLITTNPNELFKNPLSQNTNPQGNSPVPPTSSGSSEAPAGPGVDKLDMYAAAETPKAGETSTPQAQ